MGCSSCANNKDGTPSGCGNNGHCLTGGCNKMNTHDWLSDMEIKDPLAFNMVEVSFKQGSRKDFFRNPISNRTNTGDVVVVDAGSGYDVGRISLSGELVRLQLKKKKVPNDREFRKLIRVANNRDLEKLDEARAMEQRVMVRARIIARTLDLDMKISDVEFQGDKRKATFYYIAEGRVDFRELVRHYAKEFKIKIEMRQIGSRQESARIGGLGSCGRELCCSTWLSDFKSVSTTAARYQNISINQTKLSGQCGRLKCCLNYELDTYMKALESFPSNVERLKTKKGDVSFIKMDIFKGIMYYGYNDPKLRGKITPLTKERVAEIKAMNKNGKVPDDLVAYVSPDDELDVTDFDSDVTGAVELPDEKRKKKRNNRNKKRKPSNKSKGSRGKDRSEKKSDGNKTDKKRPQGEKKSDKTQKPKRNKWRNKKPKNKDKE